MEIAASRNSSLTLAPGDYATDIASRRYHEPVIENSPYQKLYQESLDTMDAHVDDGNPPQEIAEAMPKLFEKENPKVHYQWVLSCKSYPKP